MGLEGNSRINGAIVAGMMHESKMTTVLFVRDLARAAAFYCEVAELKTLRVSPDHLVVGSATFQLVLHAMPAHVLKTCAIENPPRRREETPIKLSFPVRNIASARRREGQVRSHHSES